MLAQNFKTPADLGISDAEFEALVKVLGMLERGEIKREQFDMNCIGNPNCGTPGCLLGWARAITANGHLFDLCWNDGPVKPIHRLFMFTDVKGCSAWAGRRQNTTVAQAAIALRNYLTHGEPRWDEALAE